VRVDRDYEADAERRARTPVIESHVYAVLVEIMRQGKLSTPDEAVLQVRHHRDKYIFATMTILSFQR
jgi:hypothetical protein